MEPLSYWPRSDCPNIFEGPSSGYLFSDASCERREASCIVALPEEEVLSVVIVEDGIFIVTGVEVVKGI